MHILFIETNPVWLELPAAGIGFHVSKPGRAIESCTICENAKTLEAMERKSSLAFLRSGAKFDKYNQLLRVHEHFE